MYQPGNNEYASFYEGYIQQVKGQEIIAFLEKQADSLEKFFDAIPGEKHDFAYAEGKWTLKEVLSHIIDTERVMTYRALRFSRGDQTGLPGFDQDLYVRNTEVTNVPFADLVKEFSLLRRANLYFFKSLSEEDYAKGGLANDLYITVGALLFVAAGHVAHHLAIIKERYL